MSDEAKTGASRRDTQDLSPKALLKVFQDVLKNRTVTTLLVARGASEKVFYFTVGAIRMVTVGPSEGLPLAQVLLGRGLLDRRTLDAAEMKRRSMEVPLRDAAGGDETSERMVRPLLEDIISQEDLIPRKDLHEAVATVVRWELEEVLFWDDAKMTVWQGSPPIDIYRGDLEAHKMSFGVDAMLEDLCQRIAARGQREARVLLGANGVAVTKPAGGQLDGLDRAILDAAREASADVLTTIRASRFVGARPLDAGIRLLELEASGILAIASSRAPQSPERLKGEAQSIEEWIQGLLDGLAAHGQLASVYEQLQQPEKAVEHRRLLAERLAEGGQLESALDEYNKILRVSKRDFPAYERIMEILEALKREPELVGVARHYAELLSVNGLFNRARRAWNYFLRWRPEDVEARRKLADAHLQVRDKAGALKELQNVATILERRGDKEALPGALQDILRVDPRDAEAVERYKVASGFNSRKMLRAVLGSVVALALVAGLIMAFLIRRVSTNFVIARDEALKAVERKSFGQANDVMSAFIDNQNPVLAGFILDQAEGLRRSIRGNAKSYYEARVTTTYEKARWLAGNQELPEARLAISELQRELRAEPEGLLAEREAWLKKLSALDDAFAADEASARETFKRAKALASEGRRREAHALYKQLGPGSLWLPGLREAEVPMALESTPPGASVRLPGRSPIRTPTESASLPFGLLAGGEAELVAQKDGYAETRARGEALWGWPVEISLRKKVAWSGGLSAPVLAPLVNVGSRVYAGDCAGSVRAFEDGQPVWSRSFGLGADVRAVRASSRVVCALTGDGRVRALSPDSGAPLWDLPASLVAPALLATARGEQVVYVNEANKIAAVLAETGEPQWTEDLIGELSCPPIVLGTRIVVCARNGRFGILAARDGRLLGSPYRVSRDEPLPEPVVLRDEPGRIELAFALESGALVIVTVADDAEAPTIERLDLNLPIAQPMASQSDRLFVTSAGAKGQVLCIEARSRRIVFRTELPAEVTGPCVVSSRAAYVPTRDGIYAVGSETGTLLWHFETDGPVAARPLLLDGVLVSAAGDERIIAIVE